MCLLSGGIDSPVAAWRMMRRGCRVLFVHFHSYPVLSRASQEKARELVAQPDAVSVLVAAAAGAVRRAPAAGDPDRAAAAARRPLPPADDADRGADRAARPGAGARHRRGGRPGRVADAREHDAHHRGGGAAGAAAAHRHGQGRDHRARRSASAPIRSRSFRIRTAARCSLPKHPATKARRDEVEHAEATLPIEEMIDAGDRRRGAWRTSRSRYRMASSHKGETIVKFTPGKLAGMKAVSDARGVIAAAAMDQRGSLQKSLAQGEGRRGRASKDLEEFKIHVTEVLTQHASAILLDPEFGLPASKRRAKDAGLLLAYEKTGYDAATAGPAARSARRVVGEAAEGSGRRLHQDPAVLRPGGSEAHQRPQARVGRAHRRRVPRQRHSRSSSSSSATRMASTRRAWSSRRRSREIVAGSMAEFTKDRYGVDVMKVEMPINMKFVEGTKAFARPEGLHEAGGAGPLPPHRRGRDQAVHLSVGRRQQRRVHRVARPGRRIGDALSRACCAAARPGRTALRSTASRAPTRSASGWRAKASRTSRTSTPT